MDVDDDAVDDDGPSLLHWERNYGRVWAGETDDEAVGNPLVDFAANESASGARLQRGMLRWVVLVVDASKSSAVEDTSKRPRLSYMTAAAKFRVLDPPL